MHALRQMVAGSILPINTTLQMVYAEYEPTYR
jgi:hypothetical protein